MIYPCGYNSGFSDTMAGIQMGLAGLRGVVDTLEAKNNGASIGEALATGTSSTAMGFGTALMGRAIDQNTHSYLGTTMNSVMNTFAPNNPFAAQSLANTAIFTSMPMMMPMMPTMPMYGGFYSSFAAPPLMFGAPMPMFGGCCWRC